MVSPGPEDGSTIGGAGSHPLVPLTHDPHPSFLLLLPLPVELVIRLPSILSDPWPSFLLPPLLSVFPDLPPLGLLILA